MTMKKSNYNCNDIVNNKNDNYNDIVNNKNKNKMIL